MYWPIRKATQANSAIYWYGPITQLYHVTYRYNNLTSYKVGSSNLDSLHKKLSKKFVITYYSHFHVIHHNIQLSDTIINFSLQIISVGYFGGFSIILTLQKCILVKKKRNFWESMTILLTYLLTIAVIRTFDSLFRIFHLQKLGQCQKYLIPN